MSYTTTKRDADFLRGQAVGRAREAVRRDAADRQQRQLSRFEALVLAAKPGVKLFLEAAPDLAANITEVDRRQMAEELARSLLRRASRA